MILHPCSIISAIVLSLLALSGAVGCFGAALQESDSHLDVAQLLQNSHRTPVVLRTKTKRTGIRGILNPDSFSLRKK